MAASTDRFSPVVVATGAMVAASVIAASAFGSDDGPIFCAFRRCTGGYCPGCGGSRAVAALGRGDFAGAWSAHPWALLVVVQAAVVAAFFAMGRGARVRGAVVPILTANLIFGVAIWVTRLANGAIPIPFA